ncbi:hypothetical protein SCACP_27960 [Sporomusa carbonis]|uniref:hypothetical protein n=1 Tax=Sporomusa carbonis TaxID=3076075 RepID=UPI003A616B33
MFEWLDGLSLWWYAAGAVFVLTMAWLAYECYHAPVMDEDEPARCGHKSDNKSTED